MKKICSKCKEKKELSEFYKHKTLKYGVRSECIQCTKEYNKSRREKRKEYEKEYNLKNKDKIKDRNKKYYKNHINEIKEYRKKYYQENKEIFKEYKRKWYQENKEYSREKTKKYKEKYREILNEIENENRRMKMKSDPIYKFKHNLRSLIQLKFKNKGYTKKSKTYEILGCDWDFLKGYIENQFNKYMTWKNHGSYWHIDHIIPLAEADTYEDVVKLNHYTNLRPLEAIKNLSKWKNKPDEDYQLRFL